MGAPAWPRGRAELLRSNPNTIAVLAGDRFNPSAMGPARVDGARLYGRHMVDVMNAVGLDDATFGNHEFDLSQGDFLKRLAESQVRWFSSNTFDARGQPCPGVPEHVIFEVTNPAGRSVRVGLFGLTTNDNRPDEVTYTDVMAAARRQVAALRPRVDALIAVTHLPVPDDVLLVEALLEIDLVLGGHEHENVLLLRGARLIPIAKADANARTVYLHDLAFHAGTRTLSVESSVRRITTEGPEDPALAARVKGWVDRAFAGFRDERCEPAKEVVRATEPLDGTEASVRNQSTRLTEILARAMLASASGAQWSIYKSPAP